MENRFVHEVHVWADGFTLVQTLLPFYIHTQENHLKYSHAIILLVFLREFFSCLLTSCGAVVSSFVLFLPLMHLHCIYFH